MENPSKVMLDGRPTDASGSVVVCSMEGTRPLLIEIQALVSPTSFNMPRRTTVGIDFNRVNLLMAVLEKKVGIHLAACILDKESRLLFIFFLHKFCTFIDIF